MSKMRVRTWDGSTEALMWVEVEDVAEVVGTAVARYLGVTAVHAEDMRELLLACASAGEDRTPGGDPLRFRSGDEFVAHVSEASGLDVRLVGVRFGAGGVDLASANAMLGDGNIVAVEWSRTTQTFTADAIRHGFKWSMTPTKSAADLFSEVRVRLGIGFRTAAELAAHVATVSGRRADIVDEVFDADGLESACVHVTLGGDATVMVEWCRSTGLFSDALFTDKTRRTFPGSGSFGSVEDLLLAVWRFLGHE